MNKTVFLTRVGLLSAVSFVLMYLNFPLPPFPPWLKIDFGDVPAMIATFSLGPVAGVLVQLMKNILYFFFKGTATAGVGSVANFIAGVALVLPAGLIYRRYRSRNGALLGMSAGTLSLVVVMGVFNYYVLLPLFAAVMDLPIEAFVGMAARTIPQITDLRTLVILGVTPYNLVKGLSVSLITFLLYKHIARIFKLHAGQNMIK